MVVSSAERFLTFSISVACPPDSTVACTSNSLFTHSALGDSRLTTLVVERGSVGSGGLGTGFEKQQPIFDQPATEVHVWRSRIWGKSLGHVVLQAISDDQLLDCEHLNDPRTQVGVGDWKQAPNYLV